MGKALSLEEIHAVTLDILEEVINICEKYNIKMHSNFAQRKHPVSPENQQSLSCRRLTLCTAT